MRIAYDHSAVRVPATSANLGPGFDALGVALALHDDVRLDATAGNAVVDVVGEGADTVERGEDNLIVRTVRYVLDEVGAPQIGMRLHCENRIPHGRGLGSSASAIVAGMLLARGLVSEPELITPELLIEWGSRIEGHPDNIAPAVLGGATVGWVEGERGRAIRIGDAAALTPIAFIPSFRLSTSKARGALPAEVLHGDAAANAGRAALLSALLAGVRVGNGADAHEILMAATEDRLHQEYRRDSMPSSLALVDWLRDAGIATVISGAGPTVLALEDIPQKYRAEAATRGWKVLPLPVDTDGAHNVPVAPR